jgi:hypothetical protein
MSVLTGACSWPVALGCQDYITPHEIQTLDVPDMPILQAYVGCQCTNVVWLDLVLYSFSPVRFVAFGLVDRLSHVAVRTV